MTRADFNKFSELYRNQPIFADLIKAADAALAKQEEQANIIKTLKDQVSTLTAIIAA